RLRLGGSDGRGRLVGRIGGRQQTGRSRRHNRTGAGNAARRRTRPKARGRVRAGGQDGARGAQSVQVAAQPLPLAFRQRRQERVQELDLLLGKRAVVHLEQRGHLTNVTCWSTKIHSNHIGITKVRSYSITAKPENQYGTIAKPPAGLLHFSQLFMKNPHKLPTAGVASRSWRH